MTRTWTGSILAAVLIILIAVKHLALGFCLCNDEIFVTECPCACFAAPGDPPCNGREREEVPTESPSDDCIVAISLDAGDFFWNTDTFHPSQQPGNSVGPAEAPCVSPLHTGRVDALGAPTRGSPPAGLPAFLRTTVLRL